MPRTGPANRRQQSTAFVVIHLTRRLPPRGCYAGPVQYALPARAVADAARGLHDIGDARAVVAAAVQGRKCTIEQLEAELKCGPVHGSALFRAALAEVAQGARSGPEAALLGLIKRGRLPVPLPNARLYLGNELIARPVPGGRTLASRLKWTLGSGAFRQRTGSERCGGMHGSLRSASWYCTSHPARSAMNPTRCSPPSAPLSPAGAVTRD